MLDSNLPEDFSTLEANASSKYPGVEYSYYSSSWKDDIGRKSVRALRVVILVWIEVSAAWLGRTEPMPVGAQGLRLCRLRVARP
jgi:hypothetical protein